MHSFTSLLNLRWYKGLHREVKNAVRLSLCSILTSNDKVGRST